MATIIDALAVELSLDPAKFKKGIADAMDDMRKFKENSEKHGKEIEKNTKDQAEGFNLVTKKIGELAAAYLSFTAVKSFVNDLVATNVALNSNAAALGVSIEKLSAMNNIARMVGSSAQGMAGAIGSIQQQLVMMNAFHMPPSQEFLIGATMLGLPRGAFLGANVTPDSFIFSAARAAQRQLRGGTSQAVVSQELQKIGISDPGLIAAMSQRNPEDLKRYMEEMKKLAPSQENIKQIQDFNMELGRMEAIFLKASSSLAPMLSELDPFVHMIEDISMLLLKLSNIHLPEWIQNIIRASVPIIGPALNLGHAYDRSRGSGIPAGSNTPTARGQQGSNSGAATPAGASGAIPSDILNKARDVALHGGAGAVQQFMAAQGYPMDGNWCGEFAASVVRSVGGTPPKNAAIASNWRRWGSPVEGEPQPGDIAVRRGPVTGGLGSHVTIVESYDPKTGKFKGLGGNQGSWESNYNAGSFEFRRGSNSDISSGRGSTFDDASTASGLPRTVPGIALPSRSTLGQTFRITTPDGRSFVAKQTDVGPAPWTGRGIDINKPLSDQMGYGKDFPTDKMFKWEQIHPSGQPGGSTEKPWYERYWENLKGGWGNYHPTMLHNQSNVTNHNVSSAETHVGYTYNIHAKSDPRGIADAIDGVMKNRVAMIGANNMAGGPV